jgi:hypothetical protein
MLAFIQRYVLLACMQCSHVMLLQPFIAARPNHRVDGRQHPYLCFFSCVLRSLLMLVQPFNAPPQRLMRGRTIVLTGDSIHMCFFLRACNAHC